MGDTIAEALGDIFGRLFEGAWETKGLFEGHQIAARVTFEEIKLYIDGASVDAAKTSLLAGKDVALLRGAIKSADRTHVVEVYGQSTWWRRPKIKICVNGERVGGDEF
jgi:hypothetical protein